MKVAASALALPSNAEATRSDNARVQKDMKSSPVQVDTPSCHPGSGRFDPSVRGLTLDQYRKAPLSATAGPLRLPPASHPLPFARNPYFASTRLMPSVMWLCNGSEPSGKSLPATSSYQNRCQAPLPEILSFR